MSERIVVSEYLKQSILPEIEMPNGDVWTVRQIRESDFMAMAEARQEHERRRLAYLRKKSKEGKALGKEAKSLAKKTGDETKGEELILERIVAMKADDPVEVTPRYLEASLLAIFTEPPQTPEYLLQLGPDLIAKLNYRIGAVIGGAEAKNPLPGEPSPATT